MANEFTSSIGSHDDGGGTSTSDWTPQGEAMPVPGTLDYEQPTDWLGSCIFVIFALLITAIGFGVPALAFYWWVCVPFLGGCR